MTEDSKFVSDIIFFLGAGASVAAGIPAVGPMTDEFLEKIKKDQSPCQETLNKIIDRLKNALARENPERKLDVELILQTVHRLIAHPKDELSEFFSDSHGLKLVDLEGLKNELEAFIRNKVIRPQSIDYLSPLLDSQWGKPVHIFSVNYDPCIELLCRNLQRRLIDGFTPEWNPRVLETEDPDAVYLYKLHGSVLWYRSEDGWHVKIPIGPNNSGAKIELYDGKKADPVILYPMSKQPMEAPLLDFAYILKRRLESAQFLIVIGYSFRDDYLAALFRDAFNANPDLHMINIGPDSRKQYKELIARGSSYEHVFEHRITCLPFPVERILKGFTSKQFSALDQAIKSWRDCDRKSRMGQDIAWQTQVVPLSDAGEVAISDDLLSSSKAWQEMEISVLWRVVFRNYAMAVAMQDAELADSAFQKARQAVDFICKMFNVQLSFQNGAHQVSCNFLKPGPNGSAASIHNLYPLGNAARAVTEEIERIGSNLHPSVPPVISKSLAIGKPLLIEPPRLQRSDYPSIETPSLSEKMRGTVTFIERLAALSSPASLEDFYKCLHQQMTDVWKSQFMQWEKELKRLPGRDAPKFGPRITDICRAELPWAFQELLNAMQEINRELQELGAS